MRLGRKSRLWAVTCLVALLVMASSFSAVAKRMLVGVSRLQEATAVLAEVGGQQVKSFNRLNVVLADVPDDKVKNLNKLKGVRYVEADSVTRQLAPVTPWGVSRVLDEQPPLVWRQSTGRGVAVVIMDTGVDGRHEDLNLQKIGFTSPLVGGDYRTDLNGHGTHVAGVVAALDDNFGVVGVAPDVDLYSVKVLNDLGTGTVSALIEGLSWVIENQRLLSAQGRVIVNISLGTSTESQALREAVQAAYDDGILLVSAAGNDGNKSGSNDKIQYPAAYASVIAVGASNKEDIRASFSSTGEALELMAPGTGIVSTWRGGVCNSVYECWAEADGTSAAAPHVTGVAALVWSENPFWRNFRVREQLAGTAEPIGDGDPNKYGRGLVNAARALNVASYDLGEPGSLAAEVEVTATAKERYNIMVSAVDGSNEPVQGAVVTLTVTTAVGVDYTVEGYTDAEGVALFEWHLRNKDGVGLYSVRAQVDKAGYAGAVAVGGFQVP